jgi:glycosyltransferase involved in cell wall biosynthesis
MNTSFCAAKIPSISSAVVERATDGIREKLRNYDALRTSPIQVRASGRRPMITYIFRKASPTVFSIEKLFEALHAHFESSGVRVHRLELPLISKGIVSVLRNIWFVARRRKARILHITGDVHYATLLCPFSRTIITIHDCVVLQRGSGLKRLVLWTLWFGLPVRLASMIVVISEQTKSELTKVVGIPESKITVIPNFVDPSFVFSERPFASDRPRILHVGTTPNKNLPRVIAALRGIPCMLVIVGELPKTLRDDLQENGITYENFVGVEHVAMKRLYRDADIISFPSTYEGFGMPILEGQAVGRPVLTSDREPMRSVAGPSGALLVDPDSVGSIREGFIALLSDESLRTRLIAAGRENCLRFTMDAVAARYLAIYERLDDRVPAATP